ncbi:hypothetical protein [Sphingomonas sp. MMS24-J13]|uniref:hypothetical protein n=1 Tax=Sphingomonas sp. MMS24-J13 TaxID=3238686 RepID=UPI00384E3F4A
MFRIRHGGELGIFLLAQFACIGGGEKRERVGRRTTDFPQGLPAILAEGAKGIGVGEEAERAGGEVCGAGEGFDFSPTPNFVIPAKAGIHNLQPLRIWIPAFAGMTGL